jgi:hypothetical protein
VPHSSKPPADVWNEETIIHRRDMHPTNARHAKGIHARNNKPRTGENKERQSGEFQEARHTWSNAKVSDGSQPPMTFDLSLSESAGSRSLHRLVGQFEFDWLPESKGSQATSIQHR